jgi:hypothetical protein
LVFADAGSLPYVVKKQAREAPAGPAPTIRNAVSTDSSMVGTTVISFDNLSVLSGPGSNFVGWSFNEDRSNESYGLEREDPRYFSSYEV